MFLFCLWFAEPFGRKLRRSGHPPQRLKHTPTENSDVLLRTRRVSTRVPLMHGLYSSFSNCPHVPFMAVKKLKKTPGSKVHTSPRLPCLSRVLLLNSPCTFRLLSIFRSTLRRSPGRLLPGSAPRWVFLAPPDSTQVRPAWHKYAQHGGT